MGCPASLIAFSPDCSAFHIPEPCETSAAHIWTPHSASRWSTRSGFQRATRVSMSADSAPRGVASAPVDMGFASEPPATVRLQAVAKSL
jgi:hypothetical protein